ncbi:MAG: ABC transporter permease [Deinococcales bacterium]|nr:ABC transporter permease [Deinococcales bacterium]
MASYTVNRLLQGVLVLFLISLVTFFLIDLAPGGPSSLVNMESTAAEREARLKQYGLDRPAPVRYVSWLLGAVRGDLGTSINQGLPVARLLAQRMGVTLQLATYALLLTTLFGVVLGVVAAMHHNRWPDHAVSILSTIGMSVPNFWLGIVAIILFAVTLGWLPAAGSGTVGRGFDLLDRLRHAVLPAGVLAFSLMPNVVRVTRSALLEVLASDFVRTARAKGLRQRGIVWKHTFKNALVPVISILGLVTTVLLSGSVVIESVFGWAGLGRLAIDAASGRDYPVILGVTVLVGALTVLVNLLVDLLYAVADPRIRYG